MEQKSKRTNGLFYRKCLTKFVMQKCDTTMAYYALENSRKI